MRKLVNVLLYGLLLVVVMAGMAGIRYFIIQEEERVELEAEKQLAAVKAEEANDLENSSQSKDIRRVLVKKLPVYESKKIVKIKADSDTEILSYGDEITVISESGLYAEIQTETGTTGYIWSDCIGVPSDQDQQTDVPSKVVVIHTEGQEPEQAIQQENSEQAVQQENSEQAIQQENSEQAIQQENSEHDIWAWSLITVEKLEKKLEALGYIAVMTNRDSQDAVSTAKSTELANQIQADAVIHICIGNSEDPAASGAAAFCAPADSRYPAAEYYADSKRLGKYVLKYYTKATGFESAGILEEDEYPGIQRSKRPVILFRMGDLSNAQESSKMRRQRFQAKMAKGIADGVDAYFR